MKLHLPHLLRRAVLRAMFAASALSTTLFSATYAAMITPDGRTDTTVMQQGNVYDVYTNTVRGQTGFNSFSTFDVYADSTANLHLATGTANLVNVVRDKCSFIDGVLNSYKDGKIGGNIFFLNPNGIVVGKSGVVNVGSISMSTPTAYFVEQLIARDGSISPTATAAVLAGDMPINDKGLISVKGKVHALDRAEMRAGKVEVQGEVATKVKMAEVVNTGGRKMDTKGMRIEGGKLSFSKKPRAARKAAHKAEQPAEPKHDIAIVAEDVFIDGGTLTGDSIYIDPDKLAITNTTLSGNYTAEARELTLSNVQSANLQSLTLHAGNELHDGTFDGDVSLTITNSSLVVTDKGFISISADAASADANAAITLSGSTISALLAEGTVLTGDEAAPAAVTISATSQSGNASISMEGSTVSGKDVTLSAEGARNAAVTLASGSSVTAKDALMQNEDGTSSDGETPDMSEQTVGGSLDISATAGQRAEVNLQAGSGLSAETGNTLLQAEGATGAQITFAGTITTQGHVAATAAAEEGPADVTLADTAVLTAEDADLMLLATTTEGNASLTLEGGSAVTAKSVLGIAAAQEGDAAVTLQEGSSITATGDVQLQASVGRVINEDAPDVFDPDAEPSTTTPTGSGNALVSVAGSISSKGAITLNAANNGTSGNAAVQLESSARLVGDGTQTAPLGELIPERLEGETDDQYAERWKAYLDSVESLAAPASVIRLSATSLSGDAALTVRELAELMANQAAQLQAQADTGRAVIDFAGQLTSGGITATATGTAAELFIRENGVLRSVPVTLLMTDLAGDGTQYYKAQKIDAGVSLSAVAPADPAGGEGEDAPAVPSKKDGVLLEVAGQVLARREAEDEEGAGGQIQLTSAGTLRVTDSAMIDAGSAVGSNGKVTFAAPEYDMSHSAVYNAAGSDGSKGSLLLMNIAERHINDLMAHRGPQLAFLQQRLSADGGDDANEWEEGTFHVTFSGNVILTQDVDATIGGVAFEQGTTITGNGHSLTLTRDRANDIMPIIGLNTSYTIEDDVTINGVKDFSLNIDSFSYTNYLLDTYFGGEQGITVGNNFTLNATGTASFVTSGYYKNVISFGQHATLSADGGITLSAETVNGLGFALFTGGPQNLGEWSGKVLGALGANENVTDKISAFGFVKIDFKKALSAVLYHTTGKDFFNPENPSLLVAGFRVSSAEISFADNEAGRHSSLTSRNGDIAVTVHSAASVKSESKSGTLLGPVGITMGLISNEANLRIGSGVDLSAQNITLTNKTEASSDLTNTIVSGKKSRETLISFGVNVVINNDTLTIGSGSTLTAERNISIQSSDSVTNALWTNAGGGKKSTYERGDDGEIHQTEQSIDTRAQKNAVTLGVTVLDHNSEMVIDGALHAKNGDISVSSTLKEKADNSANANLCYTLAMKPEQQENQSLWADLWDCVTIEGFTLLNEKSRADLKNTFKQGEELYGEVFSKLNTGSSNDLSLAVSLSANVALADNSIRFGGTAAADKGSITLSAENALANATSSSSIIRGVPSDSAVAVSLTLPVYNDSCVVDISGSLTAGKDIAATATTSYPASLNYLNWRSWIPKEKDDGSSDFTFETFLQGASDSLTYIRKHYKDGSFGLIGSLPTTSATTQMYKTGSGSDKSKTIGGNLLVENHSSDTVVNVRDGAVLKAGGAVTLNAATTGQQILFTGELPFFLQLGADLYATDRKAASGFGGSFLFSHNVLNTLTYVGAAAITANALTMDSNDDILGLAFSVAGTGGAEDAGFNGAVTILAEEKMTVSEVSGGATLTLGSGASSVHAKDDTTTLNIVGMEADGGRLAIGAGVAVMVDKSYTAALLGSNGIPETYQTNWDSVNSAGGKELGMFAAREGDITLRFTEQGSLEIKAEDDTDMVSVGIAAAVLTANNNKQGVGDGADNVAYTEADHHTAATAYRVKAADAKHSDIAAEAMNDAVLVSVGGDVAANASGDKATLSEAVSVAINDIIFDTKASVIDSSVTSAGTLTVHADNSSDITAVTLAGSGGPASVGLAAGSAWNSISGTTGAYTTGGSLSADSLAVTANSTQEIVAITIGASLNFGSIHEAINDVGNQGGDEGGDEGDDEGDDEEDEHVINHGYAAIRHDGIGTGFKPTLRPKDELLDAYEEPELPELPLGGTPLPGSDADLLQPELGEGVSISVGAAIVRSAVDVRTDALVTDTKLTATDTVTVTAEDSSVITQVSGGAAVATGGSSNVAAGAVLSFIPLTSQVHAGIIGTSALTLNAARLDVQATAAQNARNWSLGLGVSSGSACGAVVAWSNFNDSAALAELTNVNASISGSGHEDHDVRVEAANRQQATVVSAGASGGAGTLELSGVWNHVSFGGSAQTTVSGSTLNMTHANGGDIFLHARTENELTDVMGALSLQVDAASIAGIGAAVSTVYLNKNDAEDSYTSRVLVKDSTIDNAGTTAIKAENSTEGGVYGGAVGLTMGGGAVDGTFSWLTDYSRTSALVQNATLKGAGGRYEVQADSSSDIFGGVGAAALQLGEGLGAGAFVANIMKDHGTTEALVSDSTVGTGSLGVRATADTHLNAVLVGGSLGNYLALTGQVMYAGLEHKVYATADSSTINLSGALSIDANNTVTAGKDDWSLTIGSLSVSYGGASIGISLLFLNDEDDTEAILHNGTVTAGSVSLSSTSKNTGATATLTGAGGAYAGGVVNVNRSDLTAHSNALVSGEGSLTTTAGGLSVSSSLEQSLDTTAVGAAISPGGALTLNVNLMNAEGGSQALVSDNRALTLQGDLDIKADAKRDVGYVAVNIAGGMVGVGINVAQMHLSCDTNTDYTDSSSTNGDINTLMSDAFGTVDRMLADKATTGDILADDYTGGKTDTPDAVSLSEAKEAHHVGASSNVQAGLNLAAADNTPKSATVGGDVSIASSQTLTTKATNVDVSGGYGSLGVSVIGTYMKPVTLTTVSGVRLNAGGNITLSAAGSAMDNMDDVGVHGGGVAVTISSYDWKNEAHTSVQVGNNTDLKATKALNINAKNSSEEIFDQTSVHGGLADIAVLLPTFTQSCTASLTVGDNATLSGENISLENRNDLTLKADMLDIVVAALGISVPSQSTSITDREYISIGDKATLAATESLTLSNLATKDYSLNLYHAGLALVEFAFPTLAADNKVDAAITIGNNATLRGASVSLLSEEKLKRKASLQGQTGSLLTAGSTDKNEIKVLEGSLNTATFGQNVSLSGDISVNVSTTDDSDIYTNALKVNLLDFGTDTELVNEAHLSDRISIGDGLTMEQGSLNLQTQSKLAPQKSLGESFGGGALDIGVNLKETLVVDLDSDITVGSGTLNLDNFTAHALTDAAVDARGEVRGGSLVDVRSGSVATTVNQNAAVNLAAEKQNLTITADSVDILAKNTHLRSHSQTNDMWGSTGGAVPVLEVESTVNSTFNAKVTWGAAASLKRRLTEEAYKNRRDSKVSFRAENDANLTTRVYGDASGAGGETDGIVKLNTTVDADIELQGNISAWNAVEVAAVSDVHHTSEVNISTPFIGPGPMTHENHITLNDTLHVGGNIETAGAVTLSAQGSGAQSTVNKLDGDNTDRGLSKYVTDNSALTLTGNVKAGGDATLTSSKDMTLTGSVWAGLGAYIEAALFNSETTPQFKGYIDYMQESMFGSTAAPELRELSEATANLLFNRAGGRMAPLSAASGCLSVSAPGTATIETDKLHVIKDAQVNIMIAAGYDTDIALDDIFVDNSGTIGVWVNGTGYPAAAITPGETTDSLIHISNQSSNKLTMSGNDTALNAGMKIRSIGDIDMRGNVNVLWLDLSTEGNFNYVAPSDEFGVVSFEQTLADACDEARRRLNSYTSNAEGSISDLSPYYNDIEPHTIQAGHNVSIRAYQVDLNGEIIAGVGKNEVTLNFSNDTVLLDNMGQDISIKKALQLYADNPALSVFLVKDTSNGTFYFDAEAQHFVVSDVRGDDHSITITARRIINTRAAEQPSKLDVQDGSISLIVNNTSSYELDLSNIDLNSQSKGTITLKETLSSKRIVTYTRDAQGQIIKEEEDVFGVKSPIIYSPSDRVSYTPPISYYRIQEMRNDTYGGGKVQDSVLIDSIAFPEGSDYSGDLDYSKEFQYSNGNPSGGVYIYKFNFRADHPVDISFSGVLGEGVTLDASSVRAINVNGLVTAPTVVLNSSEGAVNLGENAALTGKSGLTVTAGGDINFAPNSTISGALMNLNAKDSIGTAAARGTITGDTTLSAETAQQIVIDATHNLKVGDIQAENVTLNVAGDISRSASGHQLAANVANVTAGGSMTLNTTITGYLDGTAGGDITIDQHWDQRLCLRHLSSANGNIYVAAGSGIQAYYNLDIDDVLTEKQLNGPLSLSDAADAFSEEYREQHLREMEQYRRFYNLQDADGNYLYRDAEGNFALTPEQRQQREQQLHDAFLTTYNSGDGDVLVESIYHLSGTIYVNGNTFGSRSDAAAYIGTHTEEAAQAFAASRLYTEMAQVTKQLQAGCTGSTEIQMNALSFTKEEWQPYHKDLWHLYYNANKEADNYVPVMQEKEDGSLSLTESGGYKYIVNEETQAAVSDWLCNSALGEKLYKLYWTRDTAGNLLYQDAAGNFTGPVGAADGTPGYSADTCKLITELFKGTEPAEHYRLTAEDTAALTQKGQAQSGYTAAKQLLDSLKNAEHPLLLGKAPKETETVISAKNGSLTLTCGKSDKGIGSDAITVLLKADGTDAEGNPVYSAWKKAYIEAANKGAGLTRLSGGLESAETRVRIDSRSINEETVTALDDALILSAPSVSIQEDAATGLTTYTFTPMGYLGVEAQTLTIPNVSGNVYISTPGDLNLTDYTLKGSGSEARFTASGNISGTTVKPGDDNQSLYLYAGGSVGSEVTALTLAQGGEDMTLGIDAGADIYLRNDAEGLKLSHLLAEMVSVKTSAGIRSTDGSLNNPNIYAGRVEWTQLAAHTDFVGQQGAPLYITTWGNDAEQNGFVLDAREEDSRLDELALRSGSVLYPFLFRTGANMSSIGQADISFSGGLYMDTRTVYDALLLHQRSFTEMGESVAIHYNAVTIDGNLHLRSNLVVDSEDTYDFTLTGTLFYHDMSQAELRFKGIANKLDIAAVEAGEAALTLESDGADNAIGIITAGSVDGRVRGDLVLTKAITPGNLTLSSEQGAMHAGSLHSKQESITLQSYGDLSVDDLTTPRVAVLDSAAGRITLGEGSAHQLLMITGDEITAQMAVSDGETLHVSGAQIHRQGVENQLDIASVDAGDAAFTLESTGVSNNIGFITADSVDGRVRGNLALSMAGTRGNLTLSSEQGAMHAGILLAQEGSITLQGKGDLTVDYLMTPQAAVLSSSAGSVTIGEGVAQLLAGAARNDISALLTAADGETLHVSDMVSKSGRVNLTAVARDMRLEGTIKGREVSLSSTGTVTTAGGYISAPSGKLRVEEAVQLPESAWPQISRTENGGYHLTLQGDLAQHASHNTFTVLRGLELELLDRRSAAFDGTLRLEEGSRLILHSGINAQELRGSGTLVLNGDYNASETNLTDFSGTLEMKEGQLSLSGQDHAGATFLSGEDSSIMVAPKGFFMSTEPGDILVWGIETLKGHYEAQNLYVIDTPVLNVYGSLKIANTFTASDVRVLNFFRGEYHLGSWQPSYSADAPLSLSMQDAELWVRGDIADISSMQMLNSSVHLTNDRSLYAQALTLRGDNSIDGNVFSEEVSLNGSLDMTGLSWHAGMVHVSGNSSISVDSCTLQSLQLDTPDTHLTIHGDSTIYSVYLSKRCNLTTDNLNTYNITAEGNNNLKSASAIVAEECLTLNGSTTISAPQLQAGTIKMADDASLYTTDIATSSAITMTLGKRAQIIAPSSNWVIYDLTLSDQARIDGLAGFIMDTGLRSATAYLFFDMLQAESVTGPGRLHILKGSYVGDHPNCTLVEHATRPAYSLNGSGTTQGTTPGTTPGMDSAPGTQGITSTLSPLNLAELAMSHPSRILLAPAATITDNSKMLVAPVINDTEREENTEEEEEKRKVTAR